MSLRSLLMPTVSQWWLSRQRLEALRRKAEQKRVAQGLRHTVHYFHQTDDPYSALMVQSLPRFMHRYDVDIQAHVVNPPDAAAAPDRERLIAYSRKDAQWLAKHHGLAFHDINAQPSVQDTQDTTARLVHALAQGCFVAAAEDLSRALWQPLSQNHAPLAHADLTPWPQASPAEARAHLAASDRLRQQWGHYAGATLYYAGEWYGGVDRLHHLEQRLQALDAARPGVTGVMFAPDTATQWPHDPSSLAPAVDFFFSLRSPYSAIAAQRLFTLANPAGIQVNLRFVLPMVMRGLPVPRHKRQYISLDAAREAHRLGVPFGRINDPVGRPTERGLAVMPLAQSQGRGQAYVLSFMQGVWAEGVDAGSDKGLRLITDRAGLDWNAVQHALDDPAWRQTAEINRTEMLDLGLWGVPSFRFHNTAVWGQDRLIAIEEALREFTTMAGH